MKKKEIKENLHPILWSVRNCKKSVKQFESWVKKTDTYIAFAVNKGVFEPVVHLFEANTPFKAEVFRNVENGVIQDGFHIEVFKDNIEVWHSSITYDTRQQAMNQLVRKLFMLHNEYLKDGTTDREVKG